MRGQMDANAGSIYTVMQEMLTMDSSKMLTLLTMVTDIAVDTRNKSFQLKLWLYQFVLIEIIASGV